MEEPTGTRIDYLRFLRRLHCYWKLILMIFLGIAVPMAALALVFLPRTYEAVAIIFLEDPKRTEPGPLRDWMPPSDASFQQAVLRSRSLAEEVVEHLPNESMAELVTQPVHHNPLQEAQRLLRRLFPGESVEGVLRWVLPSTYFEQVRKAIRWFLGSEPVAHGGRQRALAELQSARVRFVPLPSGEVEIRTIAYSPRVAMDLANTYVEVLQARSRSLAREDAQVTREFIENFLNQTKASLQEAEENLARLQRARGSFRFPERATVELTQLAQLENSLADIQASKEIARARLNFLKGGKDATGKLLPGAAPLAVQQLRERLAKLQEKLAALQERYAEQHPLVLSTQAEIREVQASLATNLQAFQEPKPAGQVTLGPAERAALAKQMADLEVEISSLEAREESFKQRIARFSRKLSSLSSDEMEASKLLQKVETYRNLYTMLSQRLGTARVQEQGLARGLKVIDLAALPSAPRASPAQKLIFLGVLLGLGLGVGTAAVIEHLNRPVETEDDVSHITSLPVLGWIPTVQNGHPKSDRDRKPLSFVEDTSSWSLPVEGCRSIRTALESLMRQRGLRTIMLASAGPSEGKSTLVLNLGWVFWEMGHRLILIDADLRRPSLHQALRSSARVGLADLLSANLPLDQAGQLIKEDFCLVPAGSPGAVTGGLLSAEKIRRLLDLVKDRADLILFDSAPVLAVSDNLTLASMVDGVILVVRAGHTQARDLLRAKELLERVNASLLGVVINQVSPRESRRYYSRYLQYYVPQGEREARTLPSDDRKMIEKGGLR